MEALDIAIIIAYLILMVGVGWCPMSLLLRRLGVAERAPRDAMVELLGQEPRRERVEPRVDRDARLPLRLRSADPFLV